MASRSGRLSFNFLDTLCILTINDSGRKSMAAMQAAVLPKNTLGCGSPEEDSGRFSGAADSAGPHNASPGVAIVRTSAQVRVGEIFLTLTSLSPSYDHRLEGSTALAASTPLISGHSAVHPWFVAKLQANTLPRKHS